MKVVISTLLYFSSCILPVVLSDGVKLDLVPKPEPSIVDGVYYDFEKFSESSLPSSPNLRLSLMQITSKQQLSTVPYWRVAVPTNLPTTWPAAVETQPTPKPNWKPPPSVTPSRSPSVAPTPWNPMVSPISEPSYWTWPSPLPSRPVNTWPSTSENVWPTPVPSRSVNSWPSSPENAVPSEEPSIVPSVEPTARPSAEPSAVPTTPSDPSTVPTASPGGSGEPTTPSDPSTVPTASPGGSGEPSAGSSSSPTGGTGQDDHDYGESTEGGGGDGIDQSPSAAPTEAPTSEPSFTPTESIPITTSSSSSSSRKPDDMVYGYIAVVAVFVAASLVYGVVSTGGSSYIYGLFVNEMTSPRIASKRLSASTLNDLRPLSWQSTTSHGFTLGDLSDGTGCVDGMEIGGRGETAEDFENPLANGTIYV